jgi:shikimate kinase
MDHDASSLSHAEIEALAKRIDRPVVLVGMMGVGKTSVGRKLASQLHLPFVDADEEIEVAAQMTIPEIFETYGESYFRDGERRVIARLMDGECKVIATGGGAFCNDQTRGLILDKAISIWLDCDLDTLVERVSRKDSRPLLRGGDPREILARLQEQRRQAYSQANIHVLSHRGPHSRTVGAILQELAQ